MIKADTSFNDARKQLYINALGQTIEKSQGVVSQTIYDANLRQQLSGKLATAEGIYENAAGQTLTTIIQTHTDLQNALGNCLASSMVNLLSGKILMLRMLLLWHSINLISALIRKYL